VPTVLRILLLLTLSLLAGCGGMRLVDAQVQTLSTLPAGAAFPADARYRFERLPSQAGQAGTERLEAMAQTALAQVDLLRDDAAAQYSVLLGVRVGSYLVDAYGRPLGSPGSPVQAHVMIGGGGGMFGWGMRFPPATHYRREVSLIIRELRSGQVVYETRAVNDNPWGDTEPILAALFEAALQDFPHPGPGPRQINIEIPR
jgi:hypothetical protein